MGYNPTQDLCLGRAPSILTRIGPVPPGELPKDVMQLLKERIRSIEQLEMLLLLHQSGQRAWTSAEVYEKIRSSERSVAQALEELCQKGLLKKTTPPSPVTF